jgi:tetratricopeptide (TPR) repeat protein
VSESEEAMSELEIWNELGNIYYNTGAYNESIRAYTKAIELDQDCGQSYCNLASIYVNQGRHVEAISLLQRGIELLEEAADKALLWNRLGDVYRKLEKYDNALPAYRKALELDPDNVTFQDNLAKAELDSAHITTESNVEGSETVPEAESIQENSPSPNLPVGESASPESKETSTAVSDLTETGTVPEAPSTLSVTTEDPEAACWVFKADESASSAEEATPKKSPEPTPVILGSRILSDVPVENDVAEIPGQTAESAEVEKPDTIIAQTDQDSAPPEASLERESEAETDDTDSPSQQIDTAGNEIASQTQADPTTDAPGPASAETSEVSSSPEIKAEGSHDENNKTSPIGQPEMDESTKARANALIQMGILHWRKMDYEKASQFLNTARDLTAEFHDNRFEAICLNAIARVETDLGRISSAIQAYERAASLDPEHIFPWNKLGTLYCQLDWYEEAMAAFKKAIEHNPKDAVSWNGLGDAHHKLGRNEDAIAAYQLGNVFDQQGHEEDAITIHQVAFDADQENPRIWKEMGNIYYDAGAYDDAINAYSKAIELLDEATDKALLWNRLGAVYLQLGNHDNAIAAYRKAVELDPANATLQDHLAKVELASEHLNTEADTKSPEPVTVAEQEDPAASEPIVEELASSEYEGATPIEVETNSSKETERTDETGTDQEVLSNLPDSVEDPEPEAAYWVFKARKSLGKPSQPTVRPSIAVAGAAVSAAKPSPAIALPQFTDQAFLNDHLLLDTHKDSSVIVVEQAPKTEEATEMEYVNPVAAQDNQDSTASEVEPEAIEASDTRPVKIDALSLQAAMAGNRIADQFEKNLHSIENDIAAYRRVTEINPKNDRAWDALGNMYEAAGLHSEAIAAFEQAISLDAKKEVYHYHLGQAYAAQTHYEKAILALQKVVVLNPGYMLAHCALAGYYRRINKEAEAQEHIAIARPTMENENEYNRACFESICGNIDQAIEFLKAALDKQQIQIDWVRSDPDLDFIRTDPRFDALLHKNGNHG